MSTQANNQGADASKNAPRQSDTRVHPQENSTSFTTTDASGYPDKHDGLIAHSTPTVIQDPHEHHKHNQTSKRVQWGHTFHNVLHDKSNVPFYNTLHHKHRHEDHSHGEKPVLGHSISGQLRNHKFPIGTLVEITE
ncbi:hypothetical protein BGZ80_003031 [Entomortierella chlamydospora]|uniref:Uncharacterized protein n=1 Tax=Entomortierella chlamydospora TaxID=101097 RepID=A0A9P6N100_9FUNG|nr:hypothetical protein BGZ80_003031 [Entomortierella chlamydospora]